MSETVLGHHHLCEYYDCDEEALNNQSLIQETLLEAARRGNATIVTDVFHRFSPHGISGVVVIAESHLAIHTWPEHRCASVDIFSCSEKMNPKVILDFICERLKAKRMESQVIKRGILHRAEPPVSIKV
jgi:S-adenosylmethionine decarboxylase